MSEASITMTPNRAYALDALRGIAILAMILSGQLPFDGHALPAWMYHAQNPPPDFQLDKTLYGITWVDLVFPFFLFCMGAAFPLSLERRMESKPGPIKLAFIVLERGAMLGFFALLVEAIRPGFYSSNHSHIVTQSLALLGFFILFLLFTRFPKIWNSKLKLGLKISGWVAGLLFLGTVTNDGPEGQRLQTILHRSDIIILVLTNMAIFGMPIWMLTRRNWLPRLGIIGFLLAIRLSNIPEPLPGWVSQFWKFTPADWFYRLYYLQYLCIVIPGTIAGDIIWEWIKSPGQITESHSLRAITRHMALGLVGCASVLTVLVGLKMRCGFTTTCVCMGLCLFGWLLSRNPITSTERLYSRLFKWGSYWLILGLLFEPYEGGIRKSSPASVSYYFVTAGLANFCIIFLTVFIEELKCRRWFQLFIDNGQNPMIAYAGINNFTLPILSLTGLGAAMSKMVSTPWLGFLNGLLITLFTALTVSFLTRRKIFWRT